MFDFGAKRIFLRATSDFAELPWHGEKGQPRISPCALRQICLSIKCISDAACKKEEPPSSHPDGSEGSLAGGAKWCTAVTLFAAIPRQDESDSNERM